MRHLFRAALLALLITTGLTVSTAAQAKNACKSDDPVLVWFGERDVTPGQTVALQPMWTDGPGSFLDVPEKCVSQWTSSEPSAVRFSADGKSVTIAENAAAGSAVTVSAKIGKQTVTGTLRVYRPDLQALVGQWRQDDADCPGGNPVRELIFSANGSFSVTAQPFEHYRDYWGKWAFDSATSELKLTVESGNNIPADLDPQGIASVEGKRLTFDGLYLGSLARGENKASCTAPFTR